MTTPTRPSPAEIRSFRAENPKMRERDIAARLGISEAALVAAEVGLTAIRIDASANRFLEHVESLGEVLALSRNESAVHEKIGIYENIKTGKHSAIVLGENIDLRIFPSRWVHGFAVTKTDGNDVKLSLQFFDKAGSAVHKVHLRPASDVAAYHAMAAALRIEDQSQELVEDMSGYDKGRIDGEVSRDELRDHWGQMRDTHEFIGLLKKLKIGRQSALRTVGDDYAWKLDGSAVETMLEAAAADGLPIMCFVGNDGIIQIHSGPVASIKTMGPWINVMDPTFHLHLRLDHIAEAWAVRKPTADGHVSSLEAYGADGEMIIQFFGKRKEGSDERPEWRKIIEALPKMAAESVAA
ncbi:hemin-degrading factor [Rhizobium tumorigenes]|uniref:hemin-degrading factor n=1 Tax=Rhizobium tumorigenes TaxID=2041385 RepID=UPI00241E63FD|nr:ChuX/HutX family heme-like substrate-binding protein [Rhizobium tumorigenes]WFR99799.1 hemin-degrading factor [Rhizobium tumorigenes]